MGRSVERLPDRCGPSTGPKKVAYLLGEAQCEASKLVAKTVAVGGHRLLVNNDVASIWRMKVLPASRFSPPGQAVLIPCRPNTDKIRGLLYATTSTSSSSPIAKHQQASCDWDISYSFATS